MKPSIQEKLRQAALDAAKKYNENGIRAAKLAEKCRDLEFYPEGRLKDKQTHRALRKAGLARSIAAAFKFLSEDN